jgi:hypothetical protein
MTHTGFIEVKRIGQAVWSPSEPVMNDVMNAVKMLEVTVIGDVAFMVFAMFAMVRRVSRAASCVASSVSARVTAMTTTVTAAALAVCSRTPSQKNHRHH